MTLNVNDYHALASPSKSAMWLACANSLAAGIGQPEGDNRAADLGTDKHELMTMCLQFGVDAMTYEGHVLGKGHTVNRELAVDVQTVVDNIRERIRSYELQGCTVEMQLALSVPISHITREENATGELDVALLVEAPGGCATLDVIDAKFGYQEVQAEANSQLLMYASGALEVFGLTAGFDQVNLVIEQPLRGVSEWGTTPAQIGEWVEQARPKAEKAIMIHRMAGERALKMEDFGVSEDGCKWCRAKSVCPALRAKVEETIGEGFETLNADVTALGVDRLAEVFPHLEMIEDWIKAVRARIEHEVFSGNAVPGVKVVAGKKGNRVWASEEEAEALMKKFKLKQEQIYSFKLLGPKPILEALKDQPRRLKQIEALVVQPGGKPHVVHESDKRPAIEIKPIEDGFETVDEGEDLC